MKKNFILSLMALTLLTGGIVYAISLGIEPPDSYIYNLNTCTKSSIKKNVNGMVMEYNIKGLLPNGRCEVHMSDYMDYSNPKTYENFKKMIEPFTEMAKDMSKDKKTTQNIKIPSQQEMIKQGKKLTVCKFSKGERLALVNAYKKHDGNAQNSKVENGHTTYSFDFSKISSYEKLMLHLYNYGPCNYYDPGEIPSADKEKDVSSEKTYVCKYADTTCYWTDSDKNGSAVSCTNENKSISSFEIKNKVREHVKTGMCQRL